MIWQWEPWRRLLVFWVPAVVLAVATFGIFVWQSSGSVGTEARLDKSIESLEEGVAHLEEVREDAEHRREAVAQLESDLTTLVTERFGSLEQRLTAIMRTVGDATRGAGLLPATFAYGVKEDEKLGLIRFTIKFSVDGEYKQLRDMLAAVAASDQFLMVEHLALVGEEEARSRNIGISVELSTYLNSADSELLKRLKQGWDPADAAAEDAAGEE
jgi:Tfp pilus assembly protein PilO